MGMLARNVNVKTFPEATPDHRAGKFVISFVFSVTTFNFVYAGMYTLKRFPNGMDDIKPSPFVDGSYKESCNVMMAIRNYYKDRPHILQQWIEWEANLLPKSDNVYDYISR
jgi:hypothetical protein